MTIRKFHSIEEASQETIGEIGTAATANSPGDNLRVAFEISELCLKLSRSAPERGTYRLRSVGEGRNASAQSRAEEFDSPNP